MIIYKTIILLFSKLKNKNVLKVSMPNTFVVPGCIYIYSRYIQCVAKFGQQIQMGVSRHQEDDELP